MVGTRMDSTMEKIEKNIAKVKDTMDLLKTFMEQLMKDKMTEQEVSTTGVNRRVATPLEGQEAETKRDDPYCNMGN